jgi:hypothetical protein
VTRLIDVICDRHRRQILDTRMWPAEWTHVAYCPNCDATQNASILPGVDETREMAVHEAGHTIAYLRHRITVDEVSIDAGYGFAAYTSVAAHDLSSHSSAYGAVGWACVHPLLAPCRRLAERCGGG